MPQFQILQPEPSGLDLIAKQLGAGLSNALSEFHDQKRNERESKLVSEALSSLKPGASPLDIVKSIAGLSIRPESKKLYGTLAAHAAAERFSGERENRLVRQEMNDRYNKRISDLNADIKNAGYTERNKLKDMKLNLQKEQARNQRALREGRLPTFDILESIGEETPEGEFEEVAEDRQILIPKTNIFNRKKAKKPLTDKIARHYYKKSGGDIEKAKKLAFEAGYE
jgi:hypothetical protein